MLRHLCVPRYGILGKTKLGQRTWAREQTGFVKQAGWMVGGKLWQDPLVPGCFQLPLGEVEV